jgi:hypothetical protein
MSLIVSPQGGIGATDPSPEPVQLVTGPTCLLAGSAKTGFSENPDPGVGEVGTRDPPEETEAKQIVEWDIQQAMRIYPLGDEPDYLATLNPHVKDPYVILDEATHTYSVNFDESESGDFTSQNVVSVSYLVKNCFSVFNPSQIIPKMKKNKKKWNPSHPLYGLTDSQIEAKWKADGISASTKGTWLHGQLERIMNGVDLRTLPYQDLVELRQFALWRSSCFDNRLIPFRTELKLKSDLATCLTGTIDLLAVAKDFHQKDTDVLELHMIDWKFSKQIRMSNMFTRGQPGTPCSHLDDCNYIHYTLQQNAYKWLLETYYKDWHWAGKTYTSVKVMSMQLVVFHENYEPAGEIIDLVDLQEVIVEMVENRRAGLVASQIEPPAKMRKICK